MATEQGDGPERHGKVKADEQQRPLRCIGCYSPQSARDRGMWQRLTDFCAAEPQAFGRNPETGHVTGSAFVLSPDRSSVLLTHHKKLNRWFQLGGHCDGIADVPFVALKEAYEESGLVRIRPLSDRVFDVDIHEIPAERKRMRAFALRRALPVSG